VVLVIAGAPGADCAPGRCADR